MRLLVTRPEPDASALAARLASLRFDVLVQPMMHIEFADEPPDIRSPAALLVTSRNGVRALQRWAAADGWRHVPLYAVGEGTAAEARTAGFGDVRVAGGDAKALAALVHADLDRAAGPLLYVAGRDRAADLPAMLPGLDVTTVEAYRGVAAAALDPAVAAAIRDGALDGALFFSRRTAAIFVGLVEGADAVDGLKSTVLFAASEAVAEPLAVLKPARIVVATRPDEKSVLALLQTASWPRDRKAVL